MTKHTSLCNCGKEAGFHKPHGNCTQIKPKHTPLPWKVREHNNQKRYIDAENGLTIADALMHSSLGNQDNHKANAEFIVKAVNSHYELVEALKLAFKRIKECRELDNGENITTPIDNILSNVEIRIEQALLKAGVE